LGTPTSSPLGRYLDEHELTQVSFAALSGVPQCQVSAYLNGRRKPGRDNALAIERATGGTVSAESWSRAKVSARRHERRLARAAR
jgi:DNA-binding transcriptional regulator YdaS (Cro superfamily)